MRQPIPLRIFQGSAEAARERDTSRLGFQNQVAGEIANL